MVALPLQLARSCFLRNSLAEFVWKWLIGTVVVDGLLSCGSRLQLQDTLEPFSLQLTLCVLQYLPGSSPGLGYKALILVSPSGGQRDAGPDSAGLGWWRGVSGW